jgi:hypothetical protein
MPIVAALLWLLLVGGVLVVLAGLMHLPVHEAVDAARGGCLPGGDGYLRMRLRTVDTPDVDIDWHDADMQCDGGPRPDGHGIRTMFAGNTTDGHPVRVVFGISVASGINTAHNVPTNITVIYEDEQKLFSTAGDTKCTIDAVTLQPPQPTASTAHGVRWQKVVARGFCTEPASVIGGSGTLLIDRFDFAGVVRDE